MIEHRPVLLRETLEYLRPRPGGVYVDATLGLGGHAEAILRAAEGTARLIGVEWDDEAADRAEARLKEFGAAVTVVRRNFAELDAILDALDVRAVDGLLFDLGVSSLQLDDPSRGFSFMADAPLDMRMSRMTVRTAAALLSTLGERELEQVFRQYGEEPRARALARALGRLRKVRFAESANPLRSTRALAAFVARHARRGRVHPATRVFQALRIAVNDELENLKKALRNVDTHMAAPGGRIVVISFHSLEDRIVKTAFRERARAGLVRVLTRKPIRPSAEEIEVNPRARSARLRAAERTETELPSPKG
ncbi:MAG: 16S rRNA (cytosine(1402)-N(4))-methyltransferase RsmH [Planctomycetes bacterium]|nr:16S rRNA (cytosine(1402)-N(4))-methyltransferase RsmH [Planctomycetota bacterium]